MFFKIMDPTALGAWYRTHLGMDVEQWGGAKLRGADDNPGAAGLTTWNLFKDHATPFTR